MRELAPAARGGQEVAYSSPLAEYCTVILQPGRFVFKSAQITKSVASNTTSEVFACNIFSESSTGRWAELLLPCCPSKQGELPENMLQNLFLNLPPRL